MPFKTQWGVDIDVCSHRYPGVLHGFYYTFPWVTAAQRVDKDGRDGLAWLLGLVAEGNRSPSTGLSRNASR